MFSPRWYAPQIDLLPRVLLMNMGSFGFMWAMSGQMPEQVTSANSVEFSTTAFFSFCPSWEWLQLSSELQRGYLRLPSTSNRETLVSTASRL